jgi:hypothetical protein
MGLVNCIRGLGQMTLYITNFIFMCFSLALVGLGAYVLKSDWKDFFKTQFVYAIIAGGAFMLIMSCIGCAGARTKKKRYLCPYATVIFLCLCAQLAGAALAMNFKGSMDKAKDECFNATKFNTATQNAYDYIREQFETTYNAGDCSVSPFQNNTQPYFKTVCTNSDAGFLQNFMNDQCATDQSAVTQCMAKSKWSNYTEGEKTFCTCQGALVDKIEDALGPVTKIAIAAAAFELFLVFAACLLMCDDRKKDREAPQPSTQPLSANAHGQPVGGQVGQHQAVPANGANMV